MRKKTDDLFGQFEERLYEAVIRATPKNTDALRLLSHFYTKQHKHDKALEIDKKLVSLLPDDSFCHYNLACSCSNLGMLEEGLNSLELAILLGYNDAKHMENDSDLNNLRNHPRYKEVTSRLRTRLA